MSQKQKIELLAPAGNFEKLETAIHYGADAVYLSGQAHSLRRYAGNFTLDEMCDAIRLAQGAGVCVYVAVNAFARPHEMESIRTYLEQLRQVGPDAIIIADPGIIYLATQVVPEIPIHLSTQANTTNQWSARLWQTHGVKRINAARELTLSDIGTMSAAADTVEIEAFVHGAMCISYSGRCLLSSYMAQRHSNRGQCAHPCRWKYAVLEELRPGEYMPVAEDETGTYIFNSKDLCMLAHLPEMIAAGIASLKIEGRQKGLNYLAAVVKTYRAAIDAFYESPADYQVRQQWVRELARVSPRPLGTGFYLNDPEAVLPSYEDSSEKPTIRFAGKVTGTPGNGRVEIAVRNKIETGDTLDILMQNGLEGTCTIADMQTPDGVRIETAQAGMRVKVQCEGLPPCHRNDIVRTLHAAY